MRVNLIGLFRSGTNYTRSVLEWNYDVEVYYDSFGWKHTFIPTLTKASAQSYPDGVLVAVVKNPFSTLTSWYKYATKNGRNLRCELGSFDEFLKSPIVFFDEGNPRLAPEYYFPNPVQMWNSVVWNHVSVAEGVGGAVVDYDRMLADPEATCDAMAGTLGFDRKTEDFREPDKVMVNMNDAMRPQDKDRYTLKKKFNKSFFSEKKYLDDFSADARAFVAENVEHGLLERLGKHALVDKSWLESLQPHAAD